MKNIVSIITPSFNRADVVAETAASILAQTYPHWEWVIVDDGSTDNSWEVLASIAAKDTRIKLLKRNRGPKGACTCRNIAVENCVGDYVMFLDTDDVLAPFCLEQRVQTMQEHPECDFVIFPMLLFKRELNDLNVLWNVDSDKDDILRILVGDAICQGTGTLWKKTTFEEVGMWREDLAIWQDTELHIRSLLWPVKYAKRLDLKPDVFLRISDDSLSRVGYYSLAKLKSRMLVLTEICDQMDRRHVLEKYREGLRWMASNTIKEAIISQRHTEVNQLLKFCEEKAILSKDEIRLYRQYKWYRQLKLYKFSTVFKRLEDKLQNQKINVHPSQLSTIKYQPTPSL